MEVQNDLENEPIKCDNWVVQEPMEESVNIKENLKILFFSNWEMVYNNF